MKKYFDYIRSVLITGLFILVLSTPAISQAKSEENHADHEEHGDEHDHGKEEEKGADHKKDQAKSMAMTKKVKVMEKEL